MTPRLGMRLLAALLPATVLLAPATAHAEKVVTEDAVGDVVTVMLEASPDAQEDPPLVAAPDEASTDITRTVVANGNKRLRIAVHFRDLVTSRANATVVRLVTPRRAFDIEVEKLAGSKADVSLARRNGSEVECRALRARVDGSADLVAISVPSSCVESPRWVQVGVGAITVVMTPTEADAEALSVFADDGHRDTVRDSLAKGPKVHRG